MCEAEFLGITFKELKELEPLLSKESYQKLKKNLKRQQESAPPLRGNGVYNHQYFPRKRTEYEKQNQILKDRLQWQRTCYSLMGMQNDFLSKDNKRLQKENIRLTSEHERLEKEKERQKQQTKKLEKENERHKQQIKRLLGVEKTKKTDDEEILDTSAKNGASKKRGAPKGHLGRTRPIPQQVDDIKTIPSPVICPDCGSRHIHHKATYVSKYIEDIPPVNKKVLEKRYFQGECANCRLVFTEPEAQKGPPVKIGPNLTVLLTVMRQQMGATYRKLSRFCTETLGIALTPSGVVGILSRMCGKLEPVYQGIAATLPSQEVLHGDETGWKMDGARWYLWCFCNRHLIYYHASHSRGAQVAKDLLGEDFAGILIADFYAAYNFIARTQRCLVHLLRDIHDELKISPDDNALCQLKDGIKSIIEEGLKIKALPPSIQRTKKRTQVDDTLEELTLLESTNHKTNTLIKRITKYNEHLLRFIDNQAVEFHNNRAERAIRPAVITRKTTFGNRTPMGAYNFALLASVIETCRENKKSVNHFLHNAINANQKQMLQLTRALIDTS